MNSEEASSFSTFRKQFIYKSLDDVLQRIHFRESDSLLDICCGSGELTKQITANAKIQSATAFDINPKMVDIAKSINSADNITYFVADAGNAETYKPEWIDSFDKALAFYALHWIPNWSDTMRYMYKCLKPGGVCYINIEVDHKPHYISIINDTVDELSKYHRYFKDYSHNHYPFQGNEKDFADAIRKAGFVDVHVDVDRSPDYASDSDVENKTFLSGFLPQMQYIPYNLKDEFLEDVYQKIKTKCDKTEDGNPMWKQTVYVGTARKAYND